MANDFPSLDQLRLPDEQVYKQIHANPKERKISTSPPNVRGEFVKGPIPLDWLGLAAKLPGKAAISTSLAIWFEAGRRRSNEIKLTTAILNRFGVNRKAKYRALKLLEGAKLISVVRIPRRNPVVTILQVDTRKTGTSPCEEVPCTAFTGLNLTM